MGCGASADADAGYSSRSGSLRTSLRSIRVARTPNGKACCGPDETAIDSIVLPLATAATQGPRGKGLHVVPSQRCKSQLLFIGRGNEKDVDTTSIELKNFENVDDLARDWHDAGDATGLHGVYYITKVERRASVASLTPGRYMFRWNADGERCRSPGSLPRLCDALHKAVSREAVMAYYARHPPQQGRRNSNAVAAGEVPYAMDRDALKRDLDVLKTCRSPRYLSNNFLGFRDALVALEDQQVYNLFEFSLGIMAEPGYFDATHHVVKPKDAPMAATPVRTHSAMLKNFRAQSAQFVQACLYRIDKRLADVGLKRSVVLPKLNRWYSDIAQTQMVPAGTALLKELAAEESGAQDDRRGAPGVGGHPHQIMPSHSAESTGRLYGTSGSLGELVPHQGGGGPAGIGAGMPLSTESGAWRVQPAPLPTNKIAARTNDPDIIRRGVEKTFESNHLTAQPAVPILCPQDLYHVDIYLVFPKGTENTFTMPLLYVWEESCDRVSKSLMKEYWVGTPSDVSSDFSSNSNSEHENLDSMCLGNDEKPVQLENVSTDDSDTESDDDNDSYHWRGFYATVAVAAHTQYCYRVVIDDTLWLSGTQCVPATKRYCKKFSVRPRVGPWGLEM